MVKSLRLQIVHRVLARSTPANEPYRHQRNEGYGQKGGHRNPPWETAFKSNDLVYLHDSEPHQGNGDYQTDKSRTERKAHQPALLAERTGAEHLTYRHIALALGYEVNAHGRKSQ